MTEWELDIHFWGVEAPLTKLIGQGVSLSFLSVVNVPSIPLYMAIGPSWEVFSDSVNSVEWLRQHLLADFDYSSGPNPSNLPVFSHGQAQTGVMLKATQQSSLSYLTEILLYAATPLQLGSNRPLVSECSNTRAHDAAFRVFALPLCSDIYQRFKNLIMDKEDSSDQSQIDPHSTSIGDSNGFSKKRQGMLDAFEDANQQRRRLKNHGGARILKAMADVNNGIKSSQCQNKAQLRVVNDSAASIQPQRRMLARAATVASMPGFNVSQSESTEPLARGQRTSHSCVESIDSPREGPIFSEVETDVVRHNKLALTKVIMTGMRLHGFQNKKRSAQAQEKPNPDFKTWPGDQGSPDEFKSIYHQTYKAALFAFRGHMDVAIISQDQMRDVTDQLLGLFCLDPLRMRGPTTTFDTPRETSLHKTGNSADALSKPLSQKPQDGSDKP